MAYEMIVLTNMLIAILFAQSLNLITGFCGQVVLVMRLSWHRCIYKCDVNQIRLAAVATFIPAMVMAGMIGMIVGAASLQCDMIFWP